MDIELFEGIGIHLFGVKWKTDMAEKLNLSDRQISRYMSDERPIPTTLRDGRATLAVLRELLENHRNISARLISRVDGLATQSGARYAGALDDGMERVSAE